MNRIGPRQFYFSLFRLLARFRGGDARRAESNEFEAWLLGLMIFAIHYLFFVTLWLPAGVSLWETGLVLVATAFWIWLFWLLFLYIKSVIIKARHICGLFRSIPIRRAQSVLWGIGTTAMAGALLQGSPALRELGAIWLVAVAMNLLAALVLAFSDAARSPGK